MRTHLGEPKTFCAYPQCSRPFTPDGTEYCSTSCGEDHDTTQHGGTPLPEHERCTCPALIGSATHGVGRHAWDCPCFVPHPEDYTHPLENE